MEIRQAEKTVDIVEVFQMLRRHLPVIAICTVLAAMVGFVGSVLTARPETSDVLETLEALGDLAGTESEAPCTATALFIVRRDTVPEQTAQAEGEAQSDAESEAAGAGQDQVPAQLVNTYCYLTRNEVILQQVIEELDLDISYRQLLSLGSITTQVVDETPIYELAVTLPGQKLALDVCKCITRIAPDAVAELVQTGKAEVILPAYVATEEAANASAGNTAKPAAAAQGAAKGKSRLILYTVLMAVLGFCATVCVLFVRFVLNNRINRETDVEQYLDMQVLGIIPMYEGEDR